MDELNVSEIIKHTRSDQGKTFGIFNAHYLSTALQPVFSIAHKRIVGYEALVRSEYSVNLADLFSARYGVPLANQFNFGLMEIQRDPDGQGASFEFQRS